LYSLNTSTNNAFNRYPSVTTLYYKTLFKLPPTHEADVFFRVKTQYLLYYFTFTYWAQQPQQKSSDLCSEINWVILKYLVFVCCLHLIVLAFLWYLPLWFPPSWSNQWNYILFICQNQNIRQHD
jgi:hypothetical protein